MNLKPPPRSFTDLDAFTAAMVAHRTQNLPKVDRFDSHDEAKSKQAAINEAADIAAEDAWDEWSNWIEICEDAYERGVGPAWN